MKQLNYFLGKNQWVIVADFSITQKRDSLNGYKKDR